MFYLYAVCVYVCVCVVCIYNGSVRVRGVSFERVYLHARVHCVYRYVLVNITRVRSFKRVMAIYVVRVVTGRFDVLKS